MADRVYELQQAIDPDVPCTLLPFASDSDNRLAVKVQVFMALGVTPLTYKIGRWQPSGRTVASSSSELQYLPTILIRISFRIWNSTLRISR